MFMLTFPKQSTPRWYPVPPEQWSLGTWPWDQLDTFWEDLVEITADQNYDSAGKHVSSCWAVVQTKPIQGHTREKKHFWRNWQKYWETPPSINQSTEHTTYKMRERSAHSDGYISNFYTESTLRKAQGRNVCAFCSLVKKMRNSHQSVWSEYVYALIGKSNWDGTEKRFKRFLNEALEKLAGSASESGSAPKMEWAFPWAMPHPFTKYHSLALLFRTDVMMSQINSSHVYLLYIAHSKNSPKAEVVCMDD